MKKFVVGAGLLVVLILLAPFSLVMIVVMAPQPDSLAAGSVFCQVNVEGAVTVVGDDGRGAWVLSDAQVANAAAIIAVGRSRGLEERGVVIALQTAIGESRLKNLANDGSFTYPARTSVMTRSEWTQARSVAIQSLRYPHDGIGSDWDSIGLFQQRPSAGWGTPEELLTQTYAAGKFFDAMERVDWEDLTNVAVIRAVQRSVNPETYTRFEATATQLVAMDGMTCEMGDLTSPLPGYRVTSSFSPGRVHPLFGVVRQHAGTDIAAPRGTAIRAAASGVVTYTGCTYHLGRSPCQIFIDHGAGVETRYVHMYPEGVLVDVGDRVRIGQTIGRVGSNGDSTGPHLHFEVVVDGVPVDAEEFYRTRAVPIT